MDPANPPKKRGRKAGSKNKKNTEENETPTVPKKRGRKPKQSIIKNDNPVFDNSNNNNLIIRVKKSNVVDNNIQSFNNLIEYENVEKENKCKMCWNCCHSFENNIYGLPIKYIKNIFYIYGYFCSLECAARFNQDTNQNPFEIYSLINFYYNTINNTIDQSINIAPSKLVIDVFGGNQTIDEYRSSFKTNSIFNVNLPPIIPINHEIKSYENNNYALSKSNLKLYRKKNLPKEEKSISNSMNLDIT